MSGRRSVRQEVSGRELSGQEVSGRELSVLELSVGEMSVGEVSSRGNVRRGSFRSGKCPSGNSLSGKCPVGDVSVGDVSGYPMPHALIGCSTLIKLLSIHGTGNSTTFLINISVFVHTRHPTLFYKNKQDLTRTRTRTRPEPELANSSNIVRCRQKGRKFPQTKCFK